jgi:hypothetical protein
MFITWSLSAVKERWVSLRAAHPTDYNMAGVLSRGRWHVVFRRWRRKKLQIYAPLVVDSNNNKRIFNYFNRLKFILDFSSPLL